MNDLKPIYNSRYDVWNDGLGPGTTGVENGEI